jgi:hypothetical protein
MLMYPLGHTKQVQSKHADALMDEALDVPLKHDR